MNSHATPNFWKLFRTLPADIRKQAYKAHAQWQRDPFHPGLHFKEVNKRKQLWSARINDSYRVLGYRTGEDITWFWIGNHTEYDQLIRPRR